MVSTRRSYCAVLFAVLVVSGCRTPLALRNQTVLQAGTLSEIHQQQVLDNLAKFVRNPEAVPDFAWPKEGTLAVKDSCEGRTELNWDFTRFVGAVLGGTGNRNKENGWTLEPINDPAKLQLMRCAYQRAVMNCRGEGPSAGCPDCEVLTDQFHGADADTSSATYQCIEPGCCVWFAFGPKSAVPKCRGCELVGHYCDTYVWVLPGGYGDLANLTFTILDYATNDFPQEREMKVTMFRKEVVDAKNKVIALTPVKSDDATHIVEVIVPVRTDATDVLPVYEEALPPGERSATAGVRSFIRSQPRAPSQYLRNQRTMPMNGGTIQSLDQRLRILTGPGL